jgi:uncharacterized protein (TIGR03435 family)
MRVLHWGFLCVLTALQGHAQSPAFEVASVKPNNSGDFRLLRMQTLPNGRFSARALPVRALLVYAYNLPINPSERLSGVPDWANREMFDIEAKAPDGAFPPGVPSTEADAKMRDMLKALLADRFKLAMRRETKEVSIYALTVAKGGPRMQKATILERNCEVASLERVGCHQFMGGMGRGIHAKAVNMHDLAGFIENWTDHPVLDRTGLEGMFAMDTDGWSPMRAPIAPREPIDPNARPSGDGDMNDPTRPTLFTVVRKLGLDLKPRQGPVGIYLVEHIERPAAN